MSNVASIAFAVYATGAFVTYVIVSLYSRECRRNGVDGVSFKDRIILSVAWPYFWSKVM